MAGWSMNFFFDIIDVGNRKSEEPAVLRCIWKQVGKTSWRNQWPDFINRFSHFPELTRNDSGWHWWVWIIINDCRHSCCLSIWSTVIHSYHSQMLGMWLLWSPRCFFVSKGRRNAETIYYNVSFPMCWYYCHPGLVAVIAIITYKYWLISISSTSCLIDFSRD